MCVVAHIAMIWERNNPGRQGIIGNGERLCGGTWYGRIYKRETHGMFRFVLLLLVQGLWSVGGSESRTKHLEVQWLWKYNQLCTHSSSLCFEASASGIGDNEHCFEIDYPTEIDSV